MRLFIIALLAILIQKFFFAGAAGSSSNGFGLALVVISLAVILNLAAKKPTKSINPQTPKEDI